MRGRMRVLSTIGREDTPDGATLVDTSCLADLIRLARQTRDCPAPLCRNRAITKSRLRDKDREDFLLLRVDLSSTMSCTHHNSCEGMMI